MYEISVMFKRAILNVTVGDIYMVLFLKYVSHFNSCKVFSEWLIVTKFACLCLFVLIILTVLSIKISNSVFETPLWQNARFENI